MTPARSAFTPRERRLLDRLRTPVAAQAFLNDLAYNTEPGRPTLRSFRGVVRSNTAHCFEAAMFTAVALEQHGYPPLVLSFESIDKLDHVLFVYRRGGRWGSVARSRDPGLHGRRPVFPSPRALAASYLEPYIDFTGAVTGYAVVDLRLLDPYDWRLATHNVWRAERFLLEYPHRAIRLPPDRQKRLRAWYREYRRRYGVKPIRYRDRHHWTPIPGEFRQNQPKTDWPPPR